MATLRTTSIKKQNFIFLKNIANIRINFVFLSLSELSSAEVAVLVLVLAIT